MMVVVVGREALAEGNVGLVELVVGHYETTECKVEVGRFGFWFALEDSRLKVNLLMNC